MVEPGLRRLKRVGFWAGPALAAFVGLATYAFSGLSDAACWTAAITTLCGVWWILEPISLPATSLIPFAAFPLLGVVTHAEAAVAYGHPLVLLMLAGSMVSRALEKSGAHRRVALGMVRAVGGTGGRRLVLGFLLASTFLSMWMSNTATALMLLPVALAVIASSSDQKLAIPLLLAVAYGASIGGSGTPIGTPPNLILLGQYRDLGHDLSFVGWMKYGVPVAVLMVPIAWLWLVRGLRGSTELTLPELGRWSAAERRVLVVFALLALAWITRAEPYGGWSAALGGEGHAGDSTVAIAAAVVLFLLPSGDDSGGRLLDWESARTIPWGVFIMIGGGIAIGKAFDASGLNADLGRSLGFLTTWPSGIVTPLLGLVTTFVTEVTSNTATANVMMPILGAAAAAAKVDPLYLMLPAGLALNHAFMLPVATAPNAIMYGTGKITTRQMVREGLALNVLGIAVITIVCLLLLA